MTSIRGSKLRRIVTRMLLDLWLVILLTVSLPGLGLLIYGARYATRIYEGVSILGVNVGGLTVEQARARVARLLQEEGLCYLRLRASGQEWIVSAQDIGGTFALDQAVAEAWRLGRDGVFVDDWSTRALVAWWGYDIRPAFSLDPGRSLVYLRQVARAVGYPARSAGLSVSGLQPTASTAAAGRELDIGATQLAIVEAVSQAMAQALPPSSWGIAARLTSLYVPAPDVPTPLTGEPIDVQLVYRDIAPNWLETKEAETLVSALLAGPLTLRCELPTVQPDGSSKMASRRWSVDQATLASWLTLQSSASENGLQVLVGIDRERIAPLIQQIADDVACPPRDGRFSYYPSGRRLTIIQNEQYGVALDHNGALEVIAAGCFNPERTIALPVRTIEPRVTRAQLEALLPLNLISEGKSSFTNSSAGRLHNIKTATARFHGVVIPPQTAFSFLQELGPVTVANGYSLSWVILGDRTVLGPGGGVCQVSTTCFRAAFLGGYRILERWPHSYRVSWYEPPIGLDAAVYQPTTDLRFLNDTEYPVLIQTEVNEADASLHFRFYSGPMTRIVRLDGPHTANPVKAAEPIIEVDPSLAPGQRIQVERAHEGIDVSFYRIIEQDGQIISREELPSHYRAWPARYRVGPQPEPTPPAAERERS